MSLKRFAHFALLTLLVCGGVSAHATTLTGTMKNPDGSNFNGVLYFSLPQSTIISSTGGCSGPYYVPNTYAPVVTVTNGVPNNSVNLYDSNCMSPVGMAYGVQIVSSTGVVVNQQWVITGTSINVGTIVPVNQSTFVPTFVSSITCDSTMTCTNSGGAYTLHAIGGSGGGSGVNYPSSAGLVYGLTTSTARTATSSDLTTLLNTSPTATLTPSLLPVATTSAFGAVKCDGTTISCTSGVIAAIGGGGGSMTWPTYTGIMVYAGSSAYGTSLTAPAGTIVGTTDTQTLTNKTLDGITPTVFGYLDATSSIQTQINSKQASIGYTPAHSGANSDITSLAGLTTPLSVAQGGTGTNAPGLSAGSGITITGSWPNQVITFSGSSGGGSTTPGGSNGDLQFNCSSGFCGDASTNDDGGGNITVTSLTTLGTTGELFGNEGSAPSGVATEDALWSDSTNHRWMMNNNNGGAVQVASSDDLTNYLNLAGGTLTGNLNVQCLSYAGSTSGSVSICASATEGSNAITWPAASGAVQLTGAQVVAYSSTPTFSSTVEMSRIVLTGSISSFTMAATASGVPKVLCFEQGSSSYTVTPPSNVHGFFADNSGQIGTTSGKWNCQAYMYDASDSIWLAINGGVVNQ